MKNVLLIVLGVIMYVGAMAEEEDSVRVFELNEVVVESRKSEVGNGDVRMIASISRVEIEQMAIRTVDDVLRMMPGVDVRSRGIGGGQTDISMRGGTFDQVIIMVNGVEMNDVQTGHYSMNLPVDIALIEKIEVMHGKINLVTKTKTKTEEGEGEALPCVSTGNSGQNKRSDGRYMGRMTGGMYGYIAPAFAGRNQWENMEIAYSANYSQGNGYNAPGELNEKEKKALENSDYRIANLWFQGGCKFGCYGVNWLDFQIGAQYKDIGAGMFYGFGSQDQFDATRTALGSVRYQGQWKGWKVEAQASYRANYDRYEWHRGEREYGNFHFTQTAAASAKGGYVYWFGKTMAGVEVRDNDIRSTNIGEVIAEDARQCVGQRGEVAEALRFACGSRYLPPLTHWANRLECSWFGSQAFSFGNFSADLDINGVWSEDFGHNMGGGVNLGYEYLAGSSVYLNADRTIRMPTFTDLYYDAGNQLGNRNLKPEKAWTFAVGTKYCGWLDEAGSIEADVNGYYRIGNDIIDWVYKADDSRRPYHAENLPRIDCAGVEVGVRYKWNEWIKMVGVSYSYCWMDLGDYAECSRYLDYLSHKAVLRIEHRIAKVRKSEFGASWVLTYQKREGYYNNVDGEVEQYGGVLLLDGEVYWRDIRFKAGVQCSNMTNQRYYDYGGVLRPGAWMTGFFSFAI